MQRINGFALYDLAGHLRKLETYGGGAQKADAWFDAKRAHDSLIRLLEEDPVPISFSRESARQLSNCIDKYFLKDANGKEIQLFGDNKNEETLEGYMLSIYGQNRRNFEIIFATEMREAATYFISQRGIYHTPSLIDHADNAFPDAVRSDILDKCKDDWKAAGKCLAFSLYSACGFHVTRAVEGMLERYYQLYCQKKSGETLRGWQAYIDELKKVAGSPQPSPKTLAAIEQMKDDYRNPIAHPRVYLSETDARMLFDNGESLIIAIASEIGEYQEAHARQAGSASSSV